MTRHPVQTSVESPRIYGVQEVVEEAAAQLVSGLEEPIFWKIAVGVGIQPEPCRRQAELNLFIVRSLDRVPFVNEWNVGHVLVAKPCDY